jgi:ABC-type branched-subunit amino acid transport system substrate-binding protein
MLAAHVTAELSSKGDDVVVELTLFNHTNCTTLAEMILAADPPVHAVIGAYRSACSLQTAAVFGAAGLPQIDYSSTSPLLSNKTLYPTFFRIPPTEFFQANAIVQLAHNFGWTRVGCLAATDTYSAGLAAAFALNMSSDTLAGVSLAALVSLDTSQLPLADANVRVALQQLKAGGSAVNFLVLYPDELTVVMRVATELEMVGPGWTWLLTDTGASSVLDAPTFTALRGALAVLPIPGSGPVYDAHVYAKVGLIGDLFRFSLTGRARVNDTFVVQVPGSYVAHVFDAVTAVVLAFENIDVAFFNQQPVEAIRGYIVDELRAFNSPDTGFDGAIGTRVFFNENQDGPLAYAIANQQANSWVPLGQTFHTEGIFLSGVIWADGTTTVPSATQPSTSGKSASLRTTSSSTLGLALGFGIFAAVVTLIFLVVLFYRRRRTALLHKQECNQKPVNLIPYLAKAGVDVSNLDAKVPREIPRDYFSQLEELGKGAFGVVYKGLIRDPSGLMPEFPVATKVLQKNADESASSELLFEV